MNRHSGKQIFLIALLLCASLNGRGQCNPPQFWINDYNITFTSATVSVAFNVTVSYVIEYGPVGFTPGTDSIAGPGGTVLIVPGALSNDLIPNLTPDTYYDCYLRTKCSPVLYSVNSAVALFKTQLDCDATTIPLDTMITVHLAPGTGSWQLCSGFGNEQIFKFTAPASGEYVVFAKPISTWTEFYFKSSASGCTYQNWSCLGYFWPNQIGQQSLGQLIAGNTYYIAIDPNTTNVAYDVQFRIEPSYCPRATGVAETNALPTSFVVTWDSSFYGILEYGPPNFVPGTGGNPGPGGTIIFAGGASVTVNVPTGGYNVYLRNNCFNGFYSANSEKLAAGTSACPTTTQYGSLGSQSTLYFYGPGYWDDYSWTCGSFMMFGQENFLRFTAPSSGYFDVVSYKTQPWLYYDLFCKPAGACDVSGISCSTISHPDQYTDQFKIGPLTAGVSYDVIMDVSDSTQYNWPGFEADVSINCPHPANVQTTDVHPNSMSVQWSCDCANAYLEYGPAGFMPGTDSVAGAGGTVIQNVSSPYNLTGLTANTIYDIYVRSECGGNYSTNTSKQTQRTAMDCAAAPVATCGSTLTYSTSYWQKGAWFSYNCTGLNQNNAIEKIYSFTPAVTGIYRLLVYSGFANGTGYWYYSRFYYKDAAGTCNEQGWSCLGTDTIKNGYHTPVSFSFDTLFAGNTYLLLIDAVNNIDFNHYLWFRIECPDQCSQPILTNISDITPSSCQVNAFCSNCLGDVFLEYGPAGFSPGNDSVPGAGGTVVQNVTFPYVITGLSGGIAYDVYARQNCASATTFSANTTVLSFTTCSLPPVSVSTSAPNNLVCPGDSVTLMRNGGQLVPGGFYSWYTGYCGGTWIGNGDSITVAPGSTETYFVRAEAACGNTVCANATVYVFTDSLSTSQATSFCNGGTALLSINPVFQGSVYQWLLDGTSISGATSFSYAADTTGSYRCIVTNGACSDTSNTLGVFASDSISPLLSMNGNDSICFGQVRTMFVPNYGGIGYTYTWKLDSNTIAGASSYSYLAALPGTYSCTVTNGMCSGISNSITIFLSTPFSASASAIGTTTFCAGDSVTLAASPFGTGYTYLWRRNVYSYPGNQDSLLVFTTGTYDVIITSMAGCKDTSSAIAVLVNPLPTVSISSNDTLFCTGDTAYFVVYAQATTALQWRLNGVDITGANDTLYAATSGGSYSCIGSNSCGADTSNSINLIFNAAPTASITSVSPVYCRGDSVLLFVSSTGTSLQWQFNGSAIGGAVDTFYAAGMSGNYSCMAGNNCASVISNVISIGEDSVPVPSISGAGLIHICLGDTATLSTSYFSGYTYQWLNNMQIVPGATSYIYVVTGTGRYRIQVTDTNGCSNISTYHVVLVGCLNIPPPPPPNNRMTAADLFFDASIFPNPSTGEFILTVSAAEGVSYSIVIRDLPGKEVLRRENLPAGRQLSFGNDLRPGVYVAEITTGENHKMMRIVREE